MHMSFWWDYAIKDFLFPGLNIGSIGALVGLCFIVALFAFVFEWTKLLQAKQRQKELVLRSKQLKAICPAMAEQASLIPRNIDRPLDVSLRSRALLYTCDASLWFFLHNLGYLLMLMVMLFNGWLFISVLFGGGLGYFVFGQRFMKLNLENCAVIRDTFCMAHCGNPDAIRNGETTPVMQASTSSCHAVHTSPVTEVEVEINHCHTSDAGPSS